LYTVCSKYIPTSQRFTAELTLRQEDDIPTLHLTAAFLLFDGRNNDETFEMMQAEGAFPRLVELIQKHEVQEETRLHQSMLELMYEMSRIQRLNWEDLSGLPLVLYATATEDRRKY
jgi:hypothetical protein